MGRSVLTYAFPVVALLGAPWPTRATAQPTPTALADSARRLDSVATTIQAAPAPQDRQAALGLWSAAAALYHGVGAQGDEVAMLIKLGRAHAIPDSGIATLRSALHMAHSLGDSVLAGHALVGLARVYFGTRQPDSITSYAEQALQLEQRLGSRWGSERSSPYYFAAQAQWQLHRLDSALTLFHDAIRVAHALGEMSIERYATVSVGSIHLGVGRADSAIVYYMRGRGIAQRLGDRASEAQLALVLARAYLGMGRTDSAHAYFKQSVTSAGELDGRVAEGKALLMLAQYHVGRSEYDSAIARAREALSIWRDVATRWGEGGDALLYTLGFAHWRIGQLDSAEVYYRRLVLMKRDARAPVDATILSDIGNLYAARSQYDSAFAYYHEALRAAKPDGRGSEATQLITIGTAHTDVGRPDSAVIYLRRSFTIAHNAGNLYLEGYALLDIGYALLHLGHADSAAAYYRQASSVARRSGDREVAGAALMNLGEAQLMLHQPDSALGAAREALDMLRHINEPQHVAEVLDDIGLAHVTMGRLDSALAAYSEALRLARASHNRQQETETLRHYAELNARGAPRPDLARAVAYYDSAAAIQANIMAIAGADQRRVTIAESGTELFEHWAAAWLARGGELGAEQSILGALAVVERGRAQALLQLLRRGGASDGPEMHVAQTANRTAGADLVQEGRDLVASVRATGVPTLTYLATTDTLLTWLILPSGEIDIARQAVSRDSVRQLVGAVRGMVGAGEPGARGLPAMESRDTLVAPNTGPRRAPPADGPRLAQRRNGRLSNSAVSPLDLLGNVLLPVALARQLPRAGRLLIVPQGPVALVPFAALPIGTRTEVRPASEPLGARYAVQYAPSLSALQVLARNTDSASAPTIATGAARRRVALVVGNPAMPRVRSAAGRVIRLPSLPGAGREAKWVARALGVSMLTGSDATEHAVQALLAGARVIHLATHGFAYSSDTRVLESFVALAPDSSSSVSSDGLLTMGEVLDAPMRLTADLVVLSACQTGLGNLKQAEGTVGLQRAFLAKGAKSVLVSLWSVSDAATELLMRRFYMHWLRDVDHPGKAESLRRAQRDVRAVPRFRAPRYWAAFQLVGGP